MPDVRLNVPNESLRPSVACPLDRSKEKAVGDSQLPGPVCRPWISSAL